MPAILPTNQYRWYFNQGTHCSGPDASTMQGGTTASISGGSFTGVLISGFVANIWGRKSAIPTIQMGAITWLVMLQRVEPKATSCTTKITGSTLCSASQNITMLIVGRFINGLCVRIESS
ncbi:unnamed protein product [Penicillium camemberti]|uniref:Str. FM013 n=1 Tax=Penicillium camemberti (strain FM 013) TaxID=1429867 RepID=A0A0G4PNL3_PENC3|nr:unnamed protein product [Penicillium camemberti]